MKTAYYTFTIWKDNAMAAGYDGAPSSRQTAMVRQSERQARPGGRDNVIDLNAWRATEPDELRAEPQTEPEWDGEAREEPELISAAARPRRDHRRAMVTAELVSTLCVAAVTVVLIVRVLTF